MVLESRDIMMSLMVYAALIVFLLLIPSGVVSAHPGHIHVSQAGVSSETIVNVQGDAHAVVETETTGNSKTNIEVTVNGETQKIISDNGENISYRSSDGSVAIDVKNSTGSQTITPTPIPKSQPTHAPEKESRKDDAKEPETNVAEPTGETTESSQAEESKNFFADAIFFIISLVRSWL